MCVGDYYEIKFHVYEKFKEKKNYIRTKGWLEKGLMSLIPIFSINYTLWRVHPPGGKYSNFYIFTYIANCRPTLKVCVLYIYIIEFVGVPYHLKHDCLI